MVWPKLQPVLGQHPDIAVEFSIDNGFRNIVEEGFDAGVRLGESVEKDMVAVRIGPDWRLLAVASPDYLARNPPPVHPQDLLRHRCINRRQGRSGGLYAWEFEKDGQELRVRVDGQLTFGTSYAMVDAVRHGLGIAYMPEDLSQTPSGPATWSLSSRTGRPPSPIFHLLPERAAEPAGVPRAGGRAEGLSGWADRSGWLTPVRQASAG